MIPKAPFDKESKLMDRSKNKGKHSFECGGTTFVVDDKYDYIKQIGHGAYGIVCSALNKVNNSKVAIKKVRNKNIFFVNLIMQNLVVIISSFFFFF